METVKQPSPRLVFGVGINDADYVVQLKETIWYENGKRKRITVWECPFYRVWKNMLCRCYSAKYQERQPTYKGYTVSEEWKLFSKLDRTWKPCAVWELVLYLKYGYRIMYRPIDVQPAYILYP